MLTGVFALLLGFGLFFGSVTLIFILTPLFILLNYMELKTIEEPELVKRLGEAYVDYRKVTPMFFPIFRLKHRDKKQRSFKEGFGRSKRRIH